MQLSIIAATSPVSKFLQKLREEHLLRKQKKEFARISAIAAKYGYAADSPEVLAIWTQPPWERERELLGDLYETNWDEEFNPASPQHAEYRDGVLVVMNYPMGITSVHRNSGASRADVVRAHLPEGWEQACDRIVIRSHETTFYAGEKPLVIFYASGRKMHASSWARTWNAIDAVKTFIGIDLDANEVAIRDLSQYPDYVIEKIGDSWLWPQAS